MDILAYLNSLSAKGRYSFTLDEAIADTGKSRSAIITALRRQMKQHRIALPLRGFYLIVPPTYQRYHCLPAEYWIDDLMQHLQQPYYVGLLSAAKYYAAAHQKPLVFQVVVEKDMRPIQCGDVSVQFVKSKNIKRVPTRQFNTPAGYLQVESPEALMIDLLRYPMRSGGINNIATILTELEESIDENKLVASIVAMQTEQIILQRLGYLLEFVGAEKHANVIEKNLQTRELRTRPLINGISTKGCNRNLRWDLYINYDVEPDL
jgi:predicted transcriptional regulator of viral defense system